MADHFFRAQNAERRLNENVNLIHRECLFLSSINSWLTDESSQLLSMLQDIPVYSRVS